MKTWSVVRLFGREKDPQRAISSWHPGLPVPWFIRHFKTPRARASFLSRNPEFMILTSEMKHKIRRKLLPHWPQAPWVP